MSAYLEHRLRRAGIEAPTTVCIVASSDSWVFRDIADDLRWTFPAVRVFDPSEGVESCSLAIVPFFQGAGPRSKRQPELAAALWHCPQYVGFFEMRKRRLDIVPRRALSARLMRTRLERTLAEVLALPGRFIRGGRRRLSALFGAQDGVR